MKKIKLIYYKVKPKYSAAEPSEDMRKRIKNVDRALDAVFNRVTGRWEIHRYSKGTWHWVHEIKNDDESYRPLDNRVLEQLWKMDIMERFGSIAHYERYMDEKQKQWQDNEQKVMDHELKWNIKNDRKLWQRAAENFRAGIVNDPPEVKEKKIFSYSNQGDVK